MKATHDSDNVTEPALRYVVLSGMDPKEIAMTVRAHLEVGWELHGDLLVTTQPERQFFQAMIYPDR